MSKVDFHFPNASCAHCVRLVGQALKKTSGVSGIDADPVHGLLAIEFDPMHTNIDRIRSIMEQSGYPTRPLSEKVIPFSPQPLTNRAA